MPVTKILIPQELVALDPKTMDVISELERKLDNAYGPFSELGSIYNNNAYKQSVPVIDGLYYISIRLWSCV